MHEYSEQCRQLWAAVLERAIDDLTHVDPDKRDSAISWIKSKTAIFDEDKFTLCKNLCDVIDTPYKSLLKHSIKVSESKIVKSSRKKKIHDAMERLRALPTELMTMTEIMRTTGTPGQETIRVRLGRLGKTYKARPAQVRTADIDAVFRDNDVSDMTSKQISEKFRLVRSTVQYRLRRDKIPHKRDSMRRPKAARRLSQEVFQW